MSQLVHAVRRSPRRVRLAVGAIALVLVALSLVWIGRASADEGERSDPGAVSASVSNVAAGKADAVDATDLACTTSATFVDMPGMSETFSFGGNSTRPVLVLFQGTWVNAAEGEAFIRLTIDGSVQPEPGASVFVHEDDARTDFETNGFNFISAPLVPGTHTATIQWYSGNGKSVCVVGRSLIILHK